MCTPEDVEEQIRLQQLRMRIDNDIEYPHCYIDLADGITKHSFECPGDTSEGIVCPVEEYYMAKRRVQQLRSRSLFTFAFQNPEVARENELLGYKMFYSQK